MTAPARLDWRTIIGGMTYCDVPDEECGVGECTCRWSTVNSASIDPPYPIRNQWCPVHGGRDPDAEYERKRDDAEWERQMDRIIDLHWDDPA